MWYGGQVLLVDINVQEELNGAYFVSDSGDMIVSHHGKLSLIRETHLGITKSKLEKVKARVEKIATSHITLDEYYKTTKYKYAMDSLAIRTQMRDTTLAGI